MKKKNKLTGYILDLRNNPGGLLSQAVKISDFFLHDGEIVSTKGRKSRENRKFFAKKGDRIDGKPLVVLINNGSLQLLKLLLVRSKIKKSNFNWTINLWKRFCTINYTS